MAALSAIWTTRDPPPTTLLPLRRRTPPSTALRRHLPTTPTLHSSRNHNRSRPLRPSLHLPIRIRPRPRRTRLPPSRPLCLDRLVPPYRRCSSRRMARLAPRRSNRTCPRSAILPTLRMTRATAKSTIGTCRIRAQDTRHLRLL